MTAMHAEELINQLQLTKSSYDGGYFKRLFESERMFDGQPHLRIGSAIYYLVTPDSFSRLHQCESDELYFFLQGSPAMLLVIAEDGQYKEVTLGSDTAAGQHMHYLVRGGTWQGLRAQEGGAYSLFGVSVWPEFRPTDYVMKKREDLMRLFGNTDAKKELIMRYTDAQDFMDMGLGCRH